MFELESWKAFKEDFPRVGMFDIAQVLWQFFVAESMQKLTSKCFVLSLNLSLNKLKTLKT